MSIRSCPASSTTNALAFGDVCNSFLEAKVLQGRLHIHPAGKLEENLSCKLKI